MECRLPDEAVKRHLLLDGVGSGKPEVVDVVGGTVVGNEGRCPVRVVVVWSKFAADGLGGLVRKRGIRAFLEAHPAVLPVEDGRLHGSGRNDASPHCECSRRGCGGGVRGLSA